MVDLMSSDSLPRLRLIHVWAVELPGAHSGMGVCNGAACSHCRVCGTCWDRPHCFVRKRPEVAWSLFTICARTLFLRQSYEFTACALDHEGELESDLRPSGSVKLSLYCSCCVLPWTSVVPAYFDSLLLLSVPLLFLLSLSGLSGTKCTANYFFLTLLPYYAFF